MELLITAGKTILTYIILMLLGTNLIGLTFRGILTEYRKDEQGKLTEVGNVKSVTSILTTVVFFTISVAYYYILYNNWGILMALAAAMLMFTRLPDLLFEMKKGESVNMKNMPKQPIDIICSIISWLAFPVIWIALSTPID